MNSWADESEDHNEHHEGHHDNNGPPSPPHERPRLHLKPRSATAAAATTTTTASASSTSKSNPFGAAKPRELVLASKGIDPTLVDTRIEKKATQTRFTAEQDRQVEALRKELTAVEELMREANENELPEEEYREKAEKMRGELNDLVKEFREVNLKDRNASAGGSAAGGAGSAGGGGYAGAASAGGAGDKAADEKGGDAGAQKFERPSERRRRLEQKRREGGEDGGYGGGGGRGGGGYSSGRGGGRGYREGGGGYHGGGRGGGRHHDRDQEDDGVEDPYASFGGNTRKPRSGSGGGHGDREGGRGYGGESKIQLVVMIHCLNGICIQYCHRLFPYKILLKSLFSNYLCVK